ncbi:MAG: DNA polymerase zeta [Peltula sp. TS41687]|nr:MAG: DNA polymerase zeta [Peltula sp. TS41687]
MESFRLRLNCIDHYQAVPTRFDPQIQSHQNDETPPLLVKVPVIRVFGATQTGQKVCAHIHGAFPYLYVDYDGNPGSSDVESYILSLHASIDDALANSYRRKPNEANSKFVALITLVKGTPFYGYHEGYKLYLKIYLYNPLHINRLSDVLRQGIVMQRSFQPYEAHLQYILQWMCDYNLYGCGYMNTGKVTFRSPVPKFADEDDTTNIWHSQSISPEFISDEIELPRQSHCSIEVDICVRDILNRLEIKPRLLHHDFIERLFSPSPDEKLLPSMAGLWKDETRRRKARMPDAVPGSSPFPPEVLISMSAEPRSLQKGGWIHEAEYMVKVRAIISDEGSQYGGRRITFDSFAKRSSFACTVKTTFESVEDLHAESFQGRLAPTTKGVTSRMENGPDVDVDESRMADWSEADLADWHEEGDIAVGDKKATGTEQDKLNENITDTSGSVHRSQEQSSEDVKDDQKSQVESTDVFPNRGPITYSEMAESKCHGVSELLRTRKDIFDTSSIPLDYTGSLQSAGLSSKHSASVNHKEERQSKRRRIMQDENTAPSNDPIHSNGDLAGDLAGDLVGNIAVTHQNPGPLGSPSEYAWKQRKQPVSILRSHSHSQGSTPRASQETIKANSTKPNKSLSFSVVKDPNDPSTVDRLSQKSNASQKTPRQASSKHVSFDSWKSVEDSVTPLKSGFTSFAESSGESSSIVSEVASNLPSSFGEDGTRGCTLWIKEAPPTATFVTTNMKSYGLMPVIYQDAYYSNESDVPARTREYAGRGFRIGSNTVPFLPDFDPTGRTNHSSAADNSRGFIQMSKAFRRNRQVCTLSSWEILQGPPSRAEVEDWMLHDNADGKKSGKMDASDSRQAHHELPVSNISQIEGPTQKNRHGFKFSQKRKSSGIQQESQYMSLMSLEVHVNTRGDLVPDPEKDELTCVFWTCQANDDLGYRQRGEEATDGGILVLSESGLAQEIHRQHGTYAEEEPTELDLINRMVDIVRTYDPDILTGYEVHGGSWGYIIERARCKYDINLCNEFSRMKSQSHGRFGKDNDRWGFNHTSTILVTGRHMINIWRAMRGELNLLQYTLENVTFHLLHRRLPHYSHRDLTTWFKSGKPGNVAKVIDYYTTRVQTNLDILEKNELIPKTSEQARIIGVDFFSVFSRGSQFKVESLMFRIAKTEGFVLVSPSRKQVGQQNALECLPLVMEPQSDFYNSPLLVLDFQSLYPSIMIAYNYCYSTFLGRIVNWRGQNKMGFTDYKREPRLLELLEDQINIAPNGMLYVKPDVRKSLLAKMLGEILETRVMVKSGMKLDKEDKALQQLLNNRQLALKLIANVTYGYTSASFSGRMPCSEIADSIVQTARETLEKAIALIHSVERWGAEVVYGDTDSLFVYLKGRSKDEAFDIGIDIAQTITKMNPRPIKLKFEKVYFPCVLLAKKRYVGFKYEHKDQKEPVFDAKGIETVRRDGTPAEQKIEETALKTLFHTADLSQVKEYFQRQCSKIMQGKVSIQDFCFAREVKLGTYSDKGPPPPGAMISAKKMLHDPRLEPQYGERVPYVVITGAPGARLIDRCVAPEDLLNNEHNELDAEYYITKNLIPPLERIFNLVGANVRSWYDEMPKYQRTRRIEGNETSDNNNKDATSIVKKTMESYMKSSLCLVCREKVESDIIPICAECLARNDSSLLTVQRRVNKTEERAVNLEKICRSCAALPWGEEVRCDSKDCPVFYSRTRQMALLRNTKATMGPVRKYLEEARMDVYDW